MTMSLATQIPAFNKMKESFNPYYDYMFKLIDFTSKYNSSLYEASAKAFESFLSVRDNTVRKIENTIRTSFDDTLNNRLNDNAMASSISEFVDAWIRLAGLSEYKQRTFSFYNFLSYVNRIFEPIRENVNRTPSEVIEMKGRFNLLHYKSESAPKHKTPILVVYSLINRHYILDLLPKVSVIKNLQNQGFDVYATDWMTPAAYDKDLTLEKYAEEYVENAVEKIKEISGSQKVSLFGYCWGGIFSLIYCAKYQDNVQRLVLHATPVDIKKDLTVIEHWTAHLNADHIVDALGNVPGWFLNFAFILRNPAETILKYIRYFSEPRTLDEVMEFFSIETWLYDSTPIIGEVYRDIVDQVYRKNLLIKNKMKVGQDIINLKNITVPVLDIVGTRDDLVPPSSSKSVIDNIGSSEKKLLEFPTGHVGLCISPMAHEKLWPEVGKWLAKDS